MLLFYAVYLKIEVLKPQKIRSRHITAEPYKKIDWTMLVIL